jgi:signal transduction histidine kinase/ActR/RegA family two-component response regulator
VQSSQNPGDPAALTGLARLLKEHRNEILERFVSEVERKDLSPQGTSRSLLIDHIPRFLDEIVTELERGVALRMSQDAVDTSKIAREHGEQRWSLGYDLEALTREYGILRHCILLVAKETGARVSLDEHDVLGKCLSVGVAQATTEYIGYRDKELNAQKSELEFLAEAGQLLASSLDYRSTLSRLTGLIVPRLADWCSVHVEGVGIDETPIAHVDPAKGDVLRDMYRRFPLPSGVPYGAPHAMRTGEPQLIAEMTPEILAAIAQSPEHEDIIRSLGFRSGLVLPLNIQGNTFGVLMMSYAESGRRYDTTSLVLGRELARRASIAIDNAKLYALSQSERSRVEAATRAKDEFVAMVSHELRTPLNAILGWVRLMRNGSLPESKREHALEVIERNAQAQSQLVGDLLDISRIITGQIRLNPAQLDFSNVVDMAIEAVRPASEAKRIQITVDLDRSATVMRGDGDRLQQVVWNLLANAIKFTPKNGAVHVRVRRVESDLEMTIEDNGAGISAEFLPHVFDSFRQADASASRAHGGLGIGLSISKHLVELHGGTIEGESQGVGRGALFRLRLPISPLVSTTVGIARVVATQPREAGLEAPEGLQGLRVLVVDDEPDARELVAYVFETSGMDVRSVGSASEALGELETFTPDVIVSDIGMPVEDGYSLIRSIRTLAAEDRKNIPAIALTAFARNEDRTRALVEGFNLHMAKPVEPATLVNAVLELARPAGRRPSK